MSVGICKHTFSTGDNTGEEYLDGKEKNMPIVLHLQISENVISFTS